MAEECSLGCETRGGAQLSGNWGVVGGETGGKRTDLAVFNNLKQFSLNGPPRTV